MTTLARTDMVSRAMVVDHRQMVLGALLILLFFGI